MAYTVRMKNYAALQVALNNLDNLLLFLLAAFVAVLNNRGRAHLEGFRELEDGHYRGDFASRLNHGEESLRYASLQSQVHLAHPSLLPEILDAFGDLVHLGYNFNIHDYLQYQTGVLPSNTKGNVTKYPVIENNYYW